MKNWVNWWYVHVYWKVPIVFRDTCWCWTKDSSSVWPSTHVQAFTYMYMFMYIHVQAVHTWWSCCLIICIGIDMLDWIERWFRDAECCRDWRIPAIPWLLIWNYPDFSASLHHWWLHQTYKVICFAKLSHNLWLTQQGLYNSFLCVTMTLGIAVAVAIVLFCPVSPPASSDSPTLFENETLPPFNHSPAFLV